MDVFGDPLDELGQKGSHNSFLLHPELHDLGMDIAACIVQRVTPSSSATACQRQNVNLTSRSPFC